MSIDKRLISTGAAAGCTTDTLDIFGDSSCVALYGLNYDGSDAGDNYNGTASNVTFNAPGYIDYAASFDGSSSQITVTSTATSPIDFTARSYSFSCWVNTTSTTYQTILSKYGNSDTYRAFSLNINANGTIQAKERSGGTSYNTTSTGTVNNGSWNHIVLTKSSTNTIIYINGSLDENNANTVTSNSGSTEPFRIGAENTASPEWFDGKIDQVRIFNKALSSSEVTTLYGETSCEYTCTTDTNGFPASASSDLVAYYKLDNDATDETGSYNGTASNVTFDGGRYGSSASFNGSSSYIDLPISIITQDNFSFSLWIYPTVNYTAANVVHYVFAHQASSGSRSITFGYNGYDGFWQMVTNNGSNVSVVTMSNPTLNVWTHIAATYSTTNGLELFVNGVSQGTDTYTALDVLNHTGCKLGSRGYSAGDYFDGQLDQVRIYDKALSSTEVSSLYEDEHQCYITVDSTDPFGDSNNIALYEFENNANDSTGSYNGTASNVTYSTDSIIGTYAASFNGSSSYVEITSSPPQDSSGVMSVSFWAKTTSTSRAAFFIAQAPTPNTEFLKLENFGYQGTNSLLISYDNNFLSNINNEAISDGNWHHIVVTVGNGNVKTYKDSSLLATQSVTIADRTLVNFAIGYRKYNNDLYFNGEIDQFRFFNKALNGDEVWKLYAEGAKG
jgi:hypothetical protein